MTIIDDMLTGITKEFEKVQNKSQEIMQGYNLANQIKDLERKRNAKLLEIGRIVCDKYVKSTEVSEDALKDKANEVSGYDHEISLLQTEADSIKTASDAASSASQRADSKAGYSPTPGFECPRCHAPAAKDKKFCPLCGESLKASSSSDDDSSDSPANGSDESKN